MTGPTAYVAGSMSRRMFLARLTGIAGAIPLIVACTPAAPPAPAATAPPAAATVGSGGATQPTPAGAAAAQPRSGGILRAGSVGDFTTIDGHYYSPKVGLATWLIYDTVTRYDDALKVQPMLAESWEQSTDARQLKLNLRKGVTFHNGRELTGDDITYNFTRVTDVKTTAGIISNFIPPETTWEATDKYTVVVKSKNPWPAIFDWLEVVSILDKETTEGPDKTRKAVGTGPFTFIELIQGDHLNYGKNKNYWQSGRPYLDGINVSVHTDQQAMVTQLEAGALDLAMTPSLTDFNRLKSNPKFRAVQMENPPNFYMIQPNSVLPPLDDKRVRQAFAYTIDRKRMLDSVLLGIGEVKSLPWPPGTPAYEPSKNSIWNFDLDKAKSLLQQSGKTIPPFEMVFNAQSVEYRRMSEIWQADLAKIGVKLDLKGMELGALLDSWHNQTYKGFYIASDAWTNMQPISYFTSSSVARTSGNNGGYSNPTYTQKVNALALEPDESRRKQMLADLNDFQLDEAIVYPVATNAQTLLTSARVHGVGQRRIPLFKFTDTWMEA